MRFNCCTDCYRCGNSTCLETDARLCGDGHPLCDDHDTCSDDCQEAA